MSRVFYIDTGNMPQAKAVEHVKGLQQKFEALPKETKDFWFAQRDGGCTRVDVIPDENAEIRKAALAAACVSHQGKLIDSVLLAAKHYEKYIRGEE